MTEKNKAPVATEALQTESSKLYYVKNHEEKQIIKVTNQEFLQTLFGEDYIFCHVCSFKDDPSNIPNERRGICWGGNYYGRTKLIPNSNQYFTISTFYADENKKARRRKALFRATHVIVADDVKEKLPVENVKKLPPPTCKLETSPGSEQWIWKLDHPCTDQNKVDNLLDGLVAQGLAPDGKDPGMKGVTRYVRLPEGVNTKSKRVAANGGKAPRCKVLEWKSDQAVSIEELALPFKINLDAVRRESRVDGAADLPDHPLLAIPEIINIKSVRSNGRYDIVCPWVREHTGEQDDGAAIFTNEDGSIGFKCHHGSCQHRTGKDLLDYIEEKIPSFRKRLKSYEVKLSFAQIAPPDETDKGGDFNFLGTQTGQAPSAEKLIVGKIYLTDTGNAQRLVNRYGDLIRYCPEFKSWLIWNDQAWVPDIDGILMQFAIKSAREFSVKANTINDEDRRTQYIKWALKSESKLRLEAAIHIARHLQDIPIHPEKLDQDPFLLNVLNGTINLRTGKLRPHAKSDLITKLVQINYPSKKTDCSTWTKFLYEIMGYNLELIDYLQRVVGYCLTGDTREQCLFFLHGQGANGKSTFINVISLLIGNYAIQTASDTFMTKQNSGGATPELAALVGKRVVTANETEEGKHLAEATIKQLSGGDQIHARKLYCAPFNFSPTFKILIAGNYKPQIRGNDHGIWRRIHLIPFTVTIPPEKRNKQLGEQLKTELQAILQWAVEGCLKWQQKGLIPPKCVVNAVKDYRENMDTIGQWFEECCEFDPASITPSGELYRSYKFWTQNAGHHPMSMKRLGGALRMRGLQNIKANGVRSWKGVTILDMFHDVAVREVVSP